MPFKKKSEFDFSAVVNTHESGLLIRPSPSSGRPVVSAPKGARVRVLGQKGQWYRVDYKGITGYVYKSYIMPLEMPNKPCQ
jgi:hypothetical protein